MKRIIAMLLALFYSLTNNTEYIDSGDMHYVEGYYYTIDATTKPPNYRTLNDTKDGKLKSNDECQPSLVSAVKRHKVKLDDTHESNGFYITAGTAGEGMTLDNCNSSIKSLSDGNQIVMPYTGQLLTLPQNSSTKDMKVAFDAYGESYVMTIVGMKCWWCDLGRDTTNNDTNHEEHTWSANTQRLPAGCLLGVASDSCVVRLEDSNGDPIEFRHLYEKEVSTPNPTPET